MKSHTESNLWKDLVRALPEADLVRHEDRVTPGTPDVSYSYKVHGWIELKQGLWPAAYFDPIRFGHPLTPQQKKFLKRKDLICGHTFILAWIGNEYLMFLGRDAYQLGAMDRSQLIRASVMHTNHLGPHMYPILTHKFVH